MSKTIENDLASFSVRHRARCLEGDYCGDWRSDVEEAYADAQRHRERPGTDAHVIRIETEQRLSMTYVRGRSDPPME